MKNKHGKVLSILLLFCMLFSLMPTTVLAMESRETSQTTTNGAYTDGTWAAGGNGTATYTIDGTEVQLSKTAAAVDGMENTFDITLRVVTSTSVSTMTNSGAVVLVMDTSGSMAACAECGGPMVFSGRDYYYTHESDCTHYNRNNNTVTSTQTRLYSAKQAAQTFLSAFAGTDEAATRMISIVEFNSDSEIHLGWYNVAGGKGKNSYDTASASINRLTAGGGTNLDSGLRRAVSQLDSNDVRSITSKNVVLLTDGKPTYNSTYRNGGNGQDGSWNNNNAAKLQADAIKNRGTGIYTVCFGAVNDITYDGGPTVGEFLKSSIATSSGTAYNADNTAELMNAFKAISDSITSGFDGEGWTATDPMADKINVTSGGVPENFTTENGSTYTWTLSDAEITETDDVTEYVYTCTYRVTLDVRSADFREDTFYPTNEETFLNVDGEQYAFPVPGVKGYLPRTSVSVSKSWDDNNNQDGIRPASAEVQLLKDGVPFGDPITLNAGNNWAYTWDDLIAESEGKYHVYTVQELNVAAGYMPSVDGENNAYVITNIHSPEQISVPVEKVWNDSSNQDGIRPDSVTVKLKADGVDTGKTLTLNADNLWKGSFTSLDKFKAGKEIKYTVEENSTNGYTAKVEANSSSGGFTITNSHTPEKITIEGSKTWTDADNQDGIRPDSITINLLKNGNVIQTKVVTESDGWAWSFAGLDKYENQGETVVYTISEGDVTGYTVSYEGYDITNTHATYKRDVTVSKVWNDKDDQDGIRPADITVVLMADGQETRNTIVLSDANNWTASFTGLDKFKAGKEIKYSVKEVTVNGYESVVKGNMDDGFTITNSHTPEKITIEGSKTWTDADNQDGIRPDSITINLLKNGNVIQTKVVTESDGWAWSFAGLDKYENQGETVVYTISEGDVTGYTVSYEGYDITNTHATYKRDVTVSKVWNDKDDQDGIRPADITVVLMADGQETRNTIVLSDANNWTASFTGLDKFKAGKEIKYSVKEVTVNGYESVVKGNMNDGFTITNTHTPETISITGLKTWDDADNQDGNRPEFITVNLLRDGQVIDTRKVTAADDWSYTFADLDKYENGGEEVFYTITETSVDGYSTTYDEFDITNSYTPKETSITVTKAWADSNNADGIRPDKVTVKLLADGTDTGKTLVLDKNSNWTGSFTGLAKYDKGQLIEYTIKEVPVDGYKTVITGDAETGFVVTNSHTVLPNTGDRNHAMPWLMLMLGAGAVLAGAGLKRRKEDA